MTQQTPSPCWIVPKGANLEVRVELSFWQGSHFLNVRLWSKTEAGDLPTKQGFTLQLAQAEAFSEAVRGAVAVARERGLIS
jgi:hypothetical protein